MNKLQRTVIQDEELVLTDELHTFLGPELILRRCDLVLRTNSRALTITDAQMDQCRIQAKKKLVNFQMWCGAVIKNCTFTGHFQGNDFGHWPEQHPHGHIEDCDFSESVLDGCRFMDCDVDSIKLPKWPCFAILQPQYRRHELESIEWPGTLSAWASVIASSVEITSATVGHAPNLATQFGCSVDELRMTLQRLGQVQL